MIFAPKKPECCRLASALLGLMVCLALLTSGCLQARGDGVMATVDVRCTLDQDPARYSLQEDVLLQVSLTNQGSAAADTPFITQNDDVTLRLKGPDHGQLRELATRVPQPGIAKPSDIYALAPGQDVAYSLLLSTWFGPLQPGSYEVQLEIKSATVSHASAWFPFVVASAAMGQPAVVPATAGQNTELSLLWVDQDASPPKLLCRVIDLNRDTATMTTALTEVAADSRGVTAAMAPPGMWGEFQWIVWAEGQDLRYALKDDRDLGPVFRFALAGEMSPVGPALSAPDPDTDETGFSLLLRSADGTEFQGVEVDPAGAVVATHGAKLAGAAEHIALAYPEADSRWVVWSQTDARGVTTVHMMAWDRERGFDDPVQIGEVQAPVWALDAMSGEGKLVVAALVVADDVDAAGSPRRDGRLVRFAYALSPRGVTAPAPVISPVGVALDVADARLSISENGSPWLVLRHPLGLRIIGQVDGVFTEPFDVDGPTLAAWLAVDENELPRVILLDALGGWEVRVAVADAGAH